MATDIRAARTEDADAVAQVVDAAYRKYVERIGRKPAPMLASYPALIEHDAVFVLTEGQLVCGVLVLAPQEGYMLLENIAIHPDVQGKGLGRRMMAFAEDRARAAGLSEMRLYTNERMVENLGYYRHLGYEETDRREVDGFHRVFMRKRLTWPSSHP
jgi:ribosomal protein S18 acetylase RimI-like enzyme